jgi:hypothetical protein
VQARGRDEIFRDYHLRVGDVTFDTDPPASAPVREQRLDATQVGAAKMVTFTEVLRGKNAAADAQQADSLPALLGLDLSSERAVIDHDVFSSIYTPGKLALLVSWADEAAAGLWMPRRHAGVDALRHRRVRVIRDYGMFERREAPQYFPDAAARHPEPPRPGTR